MENTTVNNVVLDKKFDGYMSSADLHNFIAPQEITVTITISEYRQLIQKVATAQADIDAANKDKHTRNSENERLKAEVAELKAKLYELQSNMNNVKEEESEET